MTWAEYGEMRLADMQAASWITVRIVRGRGLQIPAGTPVEIVAKRNGLTIAGEPCAACGVRVLVSGVAPSSVERVTA